MASSLFKIVSRLHASSIPHVFKLSSDKSSALFPGCRNLMTISINTENELHDVLPVAESYRPTKKPCPLDPETLRKKEKGDWKCLTMEEKKALYQMSLHQSFSDTAPTDEWKTILGGTFFAMGLMTMGIYVWFTQFVCRNIETSSLPAKEPSSSPADLDPVMLMNFVDNDESSFDTQGRH